MTDVGTASESVQNNQVPTSTTSPDDTTLMVVPPEPNSSESSLRFLSVRYGLTVHTGNYSSVRLDAEAAVGTDSTAESTLQELREWVRAQSPLSEADRQHARDERYYAEQQQRDVQRHLADAKIQWETVQEVFKKLALRLPSFTEELPF